MRFIIVEAFGTLFLGLKLGPISDTAVRDWEKGLSHVHTFSWKRFFAKGAKAPGVPKQACICTT